MREKVPFEPRLLAGLSWLHPNRSLGQEMATVLSAGYVRGADLWHLASALYLARAPERIAFLTLDERQGEIAALLGFRTRS